MKLIRPITIDDTSLVSTTVAETVSTYNAGTSYSAGLQVRRDTTHRVYESAVNSNVGNTPEDSPEEWIDTGPTNPWAMFDQVTGTRTVDADEIVVVVQADGRIDSVALLNMTGSLVTIVSEADSVEVYNESFPLIDNGGITDWYSYFFEPLSLISDLVVTDLPIHMDQEVTISITGTGDVACGNCVIGQSVEIGGANYGASLGIRDFSRKEEPTLGAYQIVRRDFSKRAQFQVTVPSGRFSFVANLLTEYRATPLVWVPTDDARYTAAVVFGFTRDWKMQIDRVSHSLCTLDIEGLT